MGSPFRSVLLALLILTAARLVLAGTHELQEDEAYYFMWSERPALSYYSKGPGIAATMWLGTAIFGENEFGVRFFSPVLSLGTSLLIFALGKSLFDDRIAAWSVVFLNVTPIFTAGSMLMTIDPLSIFFWVAAMLTFWRALHTGSPWSWRWPLTGLLVGIGILAKYTNALLLLSFLIVLLSSKKSRIQFRRPGFYILLLVAAACTVPILVWNSQHDWITFTHLEQRAGSKPGFNPLEFLQFLGAHFGTYSPLLFLGLLWALLLSIFRHRREDPVFFLLAFSVPIIALYFGLSFREAGEQNWTAPGFVSVAMLLAFCFDRLRLSTGLKSWIRGVSIGVAVTVSLVIMETDLARYLGLPWPYKVDKSEPTNLDSHLPTSPSDGTILAGVGDPTQRMRGWRTSAEFVDGAVRRYRETSGSDSFLIANRWQCAAALDFYLPDDCPLIHPTPAHPRIHSIQIPGQLSNQFSFWPRYDAPNSEFFGKTALYITDDPYNNPPPPIKNAFGQWSLIAVADIVREAPPGSPQNVRTLKVFACSAFR